MGGKQRSLCGKGEREGIQTTVSGMGNKKRPEAQDYEWKYTAARGGSKENL